MLSPCILRAGGGGGLSPPATTEVHARESRGAMESRK
jgi:hypothetical protein